MASWVPAKRLCQSSEEPAVVILYCNEKAEKVMLQKGFCYTAPKSDRLYAIQCPMATGDMSAWCREGEEEKEEERLPGIRGPWVLRVEICMGVVISTGASLGGTWWNPKCAPYWREVSNPNTHTHRSYTQTQLQQGQNSNKNMLYTPSCTQPWILIRQSVWC